MAGPPKWTEEQYFAPFLSLLAKSTITAPADNKVVLVLTAIMETAKTMLHNGLDDRRTASKLMSEIARRVYDMLPGRGVIDHEPQQD